MAASNVIQSLPMFVKTVDRDALNFKEIAAYFSKAGALLSSAECW